jgi:hypothetical protein
MMFHQHMTRLIPLKRGALFGPSHSLSTHRVHTAYPHTFKLSDSQKNEGYPPAKHFHLRATSNSRKCDSSTCAALLYSLQATSKEPGNLHISRAGVSTESCASPSILQTGGLDLLGEQKDLTDLLDLRPILGCLVRHLNLLNLSSARI